MTVTMKSSAQMLGDVLSIQQQGDSQRAGEFIEKYISWTPSYMTGCAKRLRDSSRYRFVMVRYKALDLRTCSKSTRIGIEPKVA